MIKQFYFKQFNLAWVNKVKWFKVLLCITNDLFKLQSFIYSQLNDQTVLFLTIHFSISHLFAHSLNVKYFNLTHRYDFIKCYHFGPEWTWEQWQWRSALHSLNLLDWSLTVRLFNVIFATLTVGEVTPLQGCSRCILQPQLTGLTLFESCG